MHIIHGVCGKWPVEGQRGLGVNSAAGVYEAITTIAAELMYCTATTVCLRTGGFKMAVLGSSRSTPCSEE